MDIYGILYPVLSLSGMGLLFGLGLGYAGIKFRIETDAKLDMVREALPGANCGGCGYAGCGAFAEAVVNGGAKPNGCPVGGTASAQRIGEALGIKVDVPEKKASYIRCAGSCSKSTFRYDYFGMDNCRAAMQLAGGGSKSCVYGCLGGGSCILACKFGAISMVDGIAQVDTEKCTACGMCVDACPKKLIEMTPSKNNIRVACNSGDSAKVVRSHCSVGCIGCKLCEKACNYDAIHVNGTLATIDYDKCTGCGECVKKCRSGVITTVTL